MLAPGSGSLNNVKYIWNNSCTVIIQGLNGIRTHDLRDTGAMLYQLSYEATHWEQGQFIEFICSRAVKHVKYIYEIIHICTAAVDESEV